MADEPVPSLWQIVSLVVTGVVGSVLGFLARSRHEQHESDRKDGSIVARQQRQLIQLLIKRIEGLERDLGGLNKRYEEEMSSMRRGYEEESRKCEADRVSLVAKLTVAEEQIGNLEDHVAELMKVKPI